MGASPEAEKTATGCIRSCIIAFETQSSHLGNGDPYLYPDEMEACKRLST